jgi:hypothetical protein
MGSGLGQSFFLVVTLSSGQVEWSASPGSHSFEVHSCEQFRRIIRLEVDAGQTFLEGRLILSRIHLVWCWRNGPGWGMVRTVTPRGKTHLLLDTPCLVSEEWPRVGSSPGSAIKDSYYSREDSFSLGYTLFGVEGMAQGGE